MPDDEDAADAFGILADPTRIAILRAFAEALDEVELGTDSMPVLSFSEVYDRVDVDSTSRLSYHLEQLDGAYLRHTDEGWKFTFAGEAIVRLVLSGAYAGNELDPIEVEGRCPSCDAEALRVIVDEFVLFRKCADCGRSMGGLPVTPAQVESRDAASLLSSTKTRMVSHFWQFRENVCNECGGTVRVEFHDLSEEHGHFEWIAAGRCGQCWRTLNGPPSLWLSNHPASIAFHWEHGVDVLSFGLGEVIERLENGDWWTDRVAPDEYVITYQVDDAELHLSIDEDLSVLSVERVRRDPVAGL